MNTLNHDIAEAIVSSGYGDIFSVLGMHQGEKGLFIRTFQPQAWKVEVLKEDGSVLSEMEKVHDKGLFQLNLPEKEDFFAYRFRIFMDGDVVYEAEDVYRFLPVLSDFDLQLLHEGNHKHLYNKLGAHFMRHQDTDGVCFAVWAPNARRVSLVGSFNNWDGRRHQMRNRDGIWELFVPGLAEGDLYKYEILDMNGNLLPLKTDPVGFRAEIRPKTASVLCRTDTYKWGDSEWVEKRRSFDALHEPLSIYELHFGSWRRNPEQDNRSLTYREMARELPEYLRYMGFTHVEFLPLTEHPFDGSWGYQPIGLYAPTSRFGSPDDFKFLIDTLHQEGFGVILDWVPAHFPKDSHGLSWFDGTALYEHADPRKGEHKEWGTKIYNYSRNEVSNFLLANALFWLKEYHIDGLRVDAVASMLYLDYDRKDGEWIPNEYGGRENLEAVAFLKRFNEWIYAENAGFITIAEESTAWPMVSRPTYLGGLGFTMKWNMGWMHDTLEYMQREAVHRKFHHNELTFSLAYAFNENFVLPLSHDEVVHGKGSLFGKMTGDRWQKFASLRAYYGYMFTHPGKQLLFSGCEFAQDTEWAYAGSIQWHLNLDEMHVGVQRLIKDMNEMIRREAPLHELDFDREGFEWIDGGDVDHSAITFMRKSSNSDELIVVACNFTPVPLYDYKIGVPKAGIYEEILNTDNIKYGGSGVLNQGELETFEPGWNFKSYALNVTLPPLGTIVLKLKRM